MRRALVESFLRTFLTLRWEGVDENEIAVLPGGHAEGAVVNITLQDGADAFSRIPLVSPMAEGSQMFINHPQVSEFLRDQLVRFLARQRDLAPLGAGGRGELLDALGALGATQISRTLSTLAAGLPIYEATFGDAGVTVTAQGVVPAAT